MIVCDVYVTSCLLALMYAMSSLSAWLHETSRLSAQLYMTARLPAQLNVVLHDSHDGGTRHVRDSMALREVMPLRTVVCVVT
jgi:hypothetical protein